VLGATLSRLAIDDLVWQWTPDAVLLDEASMASLPLAAAAALRAKRRLLVFGDFRQLPPIYQARTDATKRWFDRDVYDSSGVRTRAETPAPDDSVSLLDMQYRMAPAICHTVSHLAYGGRLRTEPSVIGRVATLAELGPWPGTPLIVVDTSALAPGCVRESKAGSYSRLNPMHAALTLAIATRLTRDRCESVGLITPYRAQARLLAAGAHHTSLAGLTTAGTVHRLQGSERDVVVVDLVDAPPQRGASQLTGTDEELALRLLTVALSRPRGRLFLLVHRAFVEGHHPGDLSGEAVVWDPTWDLAQARLGNDITFATRSVILNLPSSWDPASHFLDTLRTASTRGLQIVLFTSAEIAHLLEDSPVDLRLLVQHPGLCALIDGRLAYVGGRSSRGPVARVDNGDFTRALEALVFGHAAVHVPPRAEAEAAIADHCGRCSTCGEPRRPRLVSGGTWTVRCAVLSHPAEPLGAALVASVLRAADVRCADCGAATVVREHAGRLFPGCSRYGRGCSARPIRLEQLFGTG
jgi:hypothetical protein